MDEKDLKKNSCQSWLVSLIAFFIKAIIIFIFSLPLFIFFIVLIEFFLMFYQDELFKPDLRSDLYFLALMTSFIIYVLFIVFDKKKKG